MCCGSPRATQIKTYSWDNAQVIMVGNKCDLEDDRIVPTEDSQRLAEELGEDASVDTIYTTRFYTASTICFSLSTLHYIRYVSILLHDLPNPFLHNVYTFVYASYIYIYTFIFTLYI